MAEYIIKTKNKKQEKVVEAFLSSMDINFHLQVQEDTVLYEKMKTDRKSALLSTEEKEDFIKSLKSAK